MITYHYCLGSGPRTLGEEFDCPKCRAVMLESFRVDVLAETSPAKATPAPGSTPSGQPVPMCDCSSCQGDVCAYCGELKGNPGCTFCRDWRKP